MDKKLLKKFAMATGVSGDEKEIRRILNCELKPYADEISFDGLGSFIARKGNKGPKIAIVAHMDEVGFMVKYIDENGFIYFETIGSWWEQSMLNHQVEVITTKGEKIEGIIGSIAPHALTDKERNSPVDINKMFIDIGANSKDDVNKMGIVEGCFIAPKRNFKEMPNEKLLAKSLDNRVACSIISEIFKNFKNEEATLYAVGTVQEEVGLRGAQTSSEKIKPDVVIIIDTTVAGDTPGIDKIKFPSKLGEGPAIVLFDKRYIPNQQLKNTVVDIANLNNIPLQYCTLKTGATDGGRYNVMGGGRPVLALCVPTRYIHANSAMISCKDYDYTMNLVDKLVNELNMNQYNELINFV